MNPFDEPELADEILETFDEICKDLGIIYFLAAGTCLGFHREGDYIPRDNDIDVRVFCNDVRFEALTEALEEDGFVASTSPEYSKMHFRKHDILLDVKRADGSTFVFDTIEHYGVTYRVPSPVEDYLQCLYGEDWKKPRWKPLNDTSSKCNEASG